MSASLNVGIYAVKPVNEQHREMCQLAELLQKQKLPIPEKVLQHFGVKSEDDLIIDLTGVIEDLNHYEARHNCLSGTAQDDYSNQEEYEIDISQLPPGTKRIKITAEISW